jgi:uncharacterized protein HemX
MAEAATTSTASTPSKAAAASTIVVQHHPIIKLAVVAILLYFLAGKAEVLWANHEQKVFDAKNAALQAQATQNAQLAEQAQAAATQSAALVAQYKDLLAQTNAQIAALRAQTKQQQQADATMPPDQLAAHWNTLIKNNNAVHPVTSGGYAVSQAGAVATTQGLDSIPEMEAEIDADQKLMVSENAVNAGLNTQITDLNSQVTGLQKQNADEVSTCNSQIAAVKSEDEKKLHKARTHGFIGWVVAAGELFLLVK